VGKNAGGGRAERLLKGGSPEPILGDLKESKGTGAKSQLSVQEIQAGNSCRQEGLGATGNLDLGLIHKMGTA
jgi:hypothetical protein